MDQLLLTSWFASRCSASDLGATPSKFQGNPCANAPGSARDNGHLPLECLLHEFALKDLLQRGILSGSRADYA